MYEIFVTSIWELLVNMTANCQKVPNLGRAGRYSPLVGSLNLDFRICE